MLHQALESILNGELHDPGTYIRQNLPEIAAVHSSRGIQKIRSVLNIESLRTKFKGHIIVNLEVLEQRHVEVCPVSVVQAVTTRIAEGQAARIRKSILVVNLGTQLVGTLRHARFGIPYSVRARRRSVSVGYTSIVGGNDYAEWGSRLVTDDT